MNLFGLAKVVRLRSYAGTYLVAGEDEESVQLQENGTCDEARWTVECTIQGLYLRSHYGRYLAVSNHPADGQGGRVVQKLPEWRWLDHTMQWKPIGGGPGNLVMLKTLDDKFLRANGNSVTQIWLSRETALDLMLWDVDAVDFNSGPTYKNLQVKALIVIGLLFIWFAHDILGLFSLLSRSVYVVFWLVRTILSVPIWLVHGPWSAITTWSTIVIGAFGIMWKTLEGLFQLLEFYEKIKNFLHQFGH